ncbi:MAG: prohibitin family protein [Oscillospiraceae bacterium]|jgi:regulator of protease activity HflC (stomatin/prohibitin superfamily)|nr:prohibitin family protein [Oscillospiraceae bacterium]
MSEIHFSTEKPRASGGNFDGKKAGRLTLWVVIAVVLLTVLFNAFTIVNEGYVGVQYRFGKIVNSGLSAGLNLKIPFIDQIQQIDTREQQYEVITDAYTSDTQNVDELRLKLTYRYDQGEMSDIIRNTGVVNVEARLLVPNVAKISKNAIGKIKAEELVQSRAEVQTAIQRELSEVLQPNGIIVTAFAIENLKFDSAFESSIQAKVIAAQDALRMKNKTAEREEEAKQKVIAAQADADSKKISAEADAKAIELIQTQLAKSPGYIDYLKIIGWNGVLPQVIGDGVNPFVVLESSSYNSTPKATGTNATTVVPTATTTSAN